MDQPDLTARMRAYLEAALPRYLEMLREMVGINSFTANPAGVDKLGELTAAHFAELGFNAETIPSENAMYGDHLVLTRPGRTARTIGFVSHLDTVFPASEEKQNDFHWREEGNRIYGPGTVDIKGGTVVMFMILDALRHLVPDVFEDVTWVLLFDASEEADGTQFGQICRERLAGDHTLACLIFEGGFVGETDANVVVARKGMAVYRLEVEGKASHAGSSHKNGANAIVQMAGLIQQIATFTDYERRITFNVGTVAGGTVVNRVPHFAAASVEMRAFAQDVYEEGMARMMALPEQNNITSPNGDYACQIDIEIIRRMKPWPRNEATDRLFALWQEAGEELGIRVWPEERGGLSDGNHFWEAIPAVDGLGPSGGNAHCSERSEDGSKDQEFVLRTSFVPKTLLNTLAILKLVSTEA